MNTKNKILKILTSKNKNHVIFSQILPLLGGEIQELDEKIANKNEKLAKKMNEIFKNPNWKDGRPYLAQHLQYNLVYLNNSGNIAFSPTLQYVGNNKFKSVNNNRSNYTIPNRNILFYKSKNRYPNMPPWARIQAGYAPI